MPNLFQRVVRSISGVQSPRPWLINLLGGTATSAGETVSNINAPKVATVYACVSLISDTIASLPFRLHRETDEGYILQPGPIDDMVRKQPNSYYNSYDFRKAMMTNLLLRGNAYILPMRNGASLAGMELIDNDYVTVDTTSGDLIYQIRLNTGVNMRLLPEQIIHLKLWTIDGINGVSPIAYAKETIGTSMAATKHLGSFYGRGATPKGILQIQGTIRDADRVRQIGQQFDERYAGANAGGTAILTEGAEYKPVALSNRESQFLETLKFGVEEICRLYKVPPHKIGHMEGAGYSNSIEAQNAQFVTDCIRPMVELIEMEFTNKLLSGSRKFNLDMRALMRGDIMTQVQRNVSYWNIGVLSANDIRKDEGLDPIMDPEADKYNKPMHMDTQQNDVTNGQQGDTQPSAAQ
jgi:HK97 family phage portal protein